MVDNEKPIMFMVKLVDESNLMVYTKDSRWGTEGLSMTFEDVSPCNLFSCIEAITVIGTSKGYAILFEVD